MQFTQHLTFQKGETMRDETVFEWSYEKTDPNHSEFLISSFGFPEPVPPASPPRSWLWAWLISGALVLCLFSGWLWKQSQVARIV